MSKQTKTTHKMIIYLGDVYEILNENVRMLDDYELIEHVNELYKEKMHISSKIFYKLKDYNDSIKLFDMLIKN